MKTLNLDLIRIDGGTQPRESIDTAYVSELAENSDKLPALVVFFDGAEYWLADGFHRYHARRLASKSTALVDIREGTQRDAILYSVGANALHGLRRTNADKRKAVGMLLADEKWASQSDHWIADACGVSHPFVASIRETTGNGYQLERTGKDGKARKVPAKPSAEEIAAAPEFATNLTPAELDAESPADIPMSPEPAAQAAPVKEDPKPLPADIAGNPIADPQIQAVFDRVGVLDALARAASAIKSDLTAGVESGDELFAELNLTQLQADCNNIHRAIRFAKPHAVCPYCQGKGRETKTCKACGGRGWVGEGRYDAAPEELKK